MWTAVTHTGKRQPAETENLSVSPSLPSPPALPPLWPFIPYFPTSLPHPILCLPCPLQREPSLVVTVTARRGVGVEAMPGLSDWFQVWREGETSATSREVCACAGHVPTELLWVWEASGSLPWTEYLNLYRSARVAGILQRTGGGGSLRGQKLGHLSASLTPSQPNIPRSARIS